MFKKYILIVFITTIMMSCDQSPKNPKFQLTQDQHVEIMVNLYTINSAISFNDDSLRDSTKQLYYKQLAEMSGISMDIIQADFDLLLTVPDSLQIVQNRAIDTLLSLQETINARPNLESLKVN